MATPCALRFLPLSMLVVVGFLSTALPHPASAGPLIRRARERQACQEFAGKLQQASGDPAMALRVYQQGVLQLVQRFGENPCRDIPAPITSAAPSIAPASDGAPTSTPTRPVTPSAKAVSPSTTATPTTGGSRATEAPADQQQQACQQFASKLQAAAVSGGAAAARQTYGVGLQTLTGLFGDNPCPNVRPPQ